MKSIVEIQDEIIEDFSLFDDWADKYAYIIELGKKLGPLEEKHKSEDNIIKGCQSRVWLHAYLNDQNRVSFETDSDAIIVKGLIYLLVKVMSDQPATEIMNANLYFIEQIGMSQHLSPTRANGLAAMVKQMKLYGVVFSSKEANKTE